LPPTATSQLRYARKPPAGPWKLTKGVVASDPGARHSLAVNSSGIPHVLSVDSTGDLRVAYGPIGPAPGWTGLPPVPSPVPLPRVDDTGMAVDRAGSVHVVFHESGSQALYHAAFILSGWIVESVDQSPGCDLGSSCALTAEPSTGRLHVAYFDATRKDLRYARKDPGGPWVRRIIEAVGDVGSDASISVDGAGKVYIAYRDETHRRLRIAAGRP